MTLGVLLAVFAGWLAFRNVMVPFPGLTETTSSPLDDLARCSSGQPRLAESNGGKKQTRDFKAKAKSLMSVKAGEVGLLKIGKSSAGDLFLQAEDEPTSNSRDTIADMVASIGRSKLTAALEKALQDQATVQARHCDQNTFESSVEETPIKVEVVQRGDSHDRLAIEFRKNERTTRFNLELPHGHGAVFRLPRTDGESVILFVGDDIASAPAKHQ